MLLYEVAKTPYLLGKIDSITELHGEIPRVSFNNHTELKLQKLAILQSVYYALLTSGIEMHIEDAKQLLFSKDFTPQDKLKAKAYQNYKKIIDYIHSFYNKSTAEFNMQYICNFHTIICDEILPAYQLGVYRDQNILFGSYRPCEASQIESETAMLLHYLETEDETHPFLKAGDILL